MGRDSSNERDLSRAVRADRAAGRTIAFANGCFDVLHVGHVRYLADAAAQADRLVVAINDDESVKGLKGPGRPILSGADRAEMVAALESVDYVVLFSDPDVNRLLGCSSPTCTARAPTTHPRPCPSARPCSPTAAASPSSAIPRITPPAICSRGSKSS